METTTKDRILDATAEMFRRYGYTGTGMKQIVTQAQAPFGSLYHFFPGGKEQLGQAVIRRSGLMYQGIFETIVDAAPDMVTGVQQLFEGAAEVLRQSDYADACPIATVALEVASVNEPLREATADVFEGWIEAARSRFVRAGMPDATWPGNRDRADRIAGRRLRISVPFDAYDRADANSRPNRR